jgi:peptide/nickel transport system substrate-binding protein
MRKRIRLASLIVLAIMFALSLAQCGPSASPEPTQAPTEAVQPTAAQPPTEVAPPTTAAETPAAGADIPEIVGTYAYPGDMPSLDPPYMLGGDTNIGMNAYETLTRWVPDKGIIPILATSWESNEDATQWTFHLRQGVTFHDGSPLTANDVKASLDRNIDVGMVAYDFIGIESIDVVDDYTVRFNASAPRDLPLILSAQYGMYIYSAEAAQQDSEWFAQGNDAGTGPYMIESYDPGKSIVLTRYSDYWGGWEAGQFTKVVYQMVEDPTVRDQMIRAGEADITLELPYDSLDVLKTVPDLTVLPYQPLAHLVAGFKVNLAPLDDINVRKALVYSFPYEDVQQGVFRGYGAVGIGFGPSSLWNPPADFPRYEFDLDKAKSFLADAGYADGLELNLALQAGVQETLDTVTMWQAQLAKIGVKLNVQQLSSGAFWDYAYNPEDTEFNIFVVPASGDVPSPYAWLICYTSSPLGWMPFVGYNNPDFDKLVFDAWAAEATDPEQAHQKWVDAQMILHNDAASVFAMDYPYIFVYRNELEGFVPNPPYPDIVFWYDLRHK